MPADDLVIQTTQELSDEFPFNEDMNSGNPLGLGKPSFLEAYQRFHNSNAGYSQNSVGGGARSSAAVAYLYPAFNRTNLDIVVNTRAVRLNQTGTEDGLPAFRAVQLTESENCGRQCLA